MSQENVEIVRRVDRSRRATDDLDGVDRADATRRSRYVSAPGLWSPERVDGRDGSSRALDDVLEGWEASQAKLEQFIDRG